MLLIFFPPPSLGHFFSPRRKTVYTIFPETCQITHSWWPLHNILNRIKLLILILIATALLEIYTFLYTIFYTFQYVPSNINIYFNTYSIPKIRRCVSKIFPGTTRTRLNSNHVYWKNKKIKDRYACFDLSRNYNIIYMLHVYVKKKNCAEFYIKPVCTYHKYCNIRMFIYNNYCNLCDWLI